MWLRKPNKQAEWIHQYALHLKNQSGFAQPMGINDIICTLQINMLWVLYLHYTVKNFRHCVTPKFDVIFWCEIFWKRTVSAEFRVKLFHNGGRYHMETSPLI